MRMTRSVLAAALGVTFLVAASPASAATLTANQACFIEGLDIGLTGSGFAPAAPIEVAGDQIATSGSAGVDGSFQTPVKAPLLGTTKPASKTFTITATDTATNTTASVDVLVATGAFTTSGGFKSPKVKRTWTFSGLFQRPGKPIYGHFRHNGKTYANYRFGVPQGPCGLLKRKAPLIPARSIPTGSWKVQVDFKRSYDAKATPRLTGSTSVIRTFG
jgi:hypothetical protein